MDQSELAFRLLARRYGAELAYTPMFLAKLFCTVPAYRRDHFATCAKDRPLIAQLAGDDPKTMLMAGAMLEERGVDAICVNLGCPQQIARKGRYGAYLLPQVGRVCEILRTLERNLGVAITCKVRLLSTVEQTVEACLRFQDAGVSMICVHGRTVEQNKQRSGAANWDAIAAVVSALDVPVLANGGVSSLEDVYACMSATGAAGVMSSEALLENPALFVGNRAADGAYISQRRLASEYVALAREHEAPLKSARSHVFKFAHGALMAHTALRDRLVTAGSYSDLENVVLALDAVDPDCDLEPWHHPPEGKVHSVERAWYFRHRSGFAQSLHADDDNGDAQQQRLARRLLKAKRKAFIRDRACARRAALTRHEPPGWARADSHPPSVSDPR